MLGPGSNWHRLRTSVNSSGLSQRRSSTSIRRANGITPPNPDSETCVNRRKSCLSAGAERVSLTAFSQASAFSFSLAVRGIIGFGEVLEVKMGVDLRGRDARMPEHFLHRAQVSGRLEQVRGEGMAQHMRV